MNNIWYTQFFWFQSQAINWKSQKDQNDYYDLRNTRLRYEALLVFLPEQRAQRTYDLYMFKPRQLYV